MSCSLLYKASVCGLPQSIPLSPSVYLTISLSARISRNPPQHTGGNEEENLFSLNEFSVEMKWKREYIFKYVISCKFKQCWCWCHNGNTLKCGWKEGIEWANVICLNLGFTKHQTRWRFGFCKKLALGTWLCCDWTGTWIKCYKHGPSRCLDGICEFVYANIIQAWQYDMFFFFSRIIFLTLTLICTGKKVTIATTLVISVVLRMALLVKLVFFF